MAVALQATAPRVLGRYVLYGEIASGGMATVHFGRLLGPAGFARPVAIKRLHAQFARDPDFVKMFFDEARLAARIAHPNVVPTLDVVAADGEVFLVMEYVRGASLAQLIRTVRKNGERVQPHICVGIVSGMLQGLHAAHEARNDRGDRMDLVHRDVSPQNVLVGTDGVPRLLDFGVAKASGRLQTTRDGQLKGKLAYMAPEQVRGDPLTRRTDVYAASVVLWEVLTGKRLFYAENEASVLARVLNAEVPAPSSIVPGLPPSFDRVVFRGLERDPAKRYATAREMAADLDAVVGVASPTEIGEWVELTAAEELRGRAALIADIERTASETIEIPPLGSPPADAHGKRPREIPSAWHQTTRREGLPMTPRDGSQVSSLSLARGSEPSSHASRKVLPAIVASGVAVLLLVGAIAVVQGRKAAGDAHLLVVSGTAAAATPAASVANASGTGGGNANANGTARAKAGSLGADAPRGVPTNVEDLPRVPGASSNGAPPLAPVDADMPSVRPAVARVAGPSGGAGARDYSAAAPAGHGPSSASPSGGAAAGGAAASGVTPAASSGAGGAGAAGPAPGASGPSGAPSDGECNPPYTADAKGHIHFKPNCM